ncbi:MAG TPA: hypothetical protein PKL24_09875, partial [Polyangiaceae bacterium]|nr:hypothetical protein [Polyangiaceae bacterium]HOD20978.1 hypothetical protein [Polyangiaceae bacterium]HOE48337.1 hypothetical protein [Polyangiaceae bacterium]HOH00112.1 hypothetical protein [Polyangiaceae bacterium]HOR33693.1 hypothetical protein [Polyangiaceae bacterium]
MFDAFLTYGERILRVSHPSCWGGYALVTAVFLSVSGCIIESGPCDECDCNENGDGSGGYAGGGNGYGGTGGMSGSGGTGGAQGPSVVRATIDTGEALETEYGKGVGVFIEVEQGGRWHVFTTCDTLESGLPCYFNVIATLPEGATYENVVPESLEKGEDEIATYSDGLELVTVTREGVDGMYFDAPAGQVVRFEVYWDGRPEARF